jgi:hypothetical protein
MIAFTTLAARRPQVRIELYVTPHHAVLLRFPSVEDISPILRLQGVNRDFAKAHKSLYYDGKILYRDISENNIIVTDAEGEGVVAVRPKNEYRRGAPASHTAWRAILAQPLLGMRSIEFPVLQICLQR